MKKSSSPFLSRRDFLAQSSIGALALGLLGRPELRGAETPRSPALTSKWPRALINRFYVKSIWGDGRHNAFPGIARVGNHYYIVFRNALTHGIQDGSARIIVIRSAADDLQKWEQVAEFTHEHDARDPLVFDNRGKVQVVFHSKEDYYSQSADGLSWPAPRLLDTENPSRTRSP